MSAPVLLASAVMLLGSGWFYRLTRRERLTAEKLHDEYAAVVLDRTAGCYDCGRPYGDEHGFPDLVVPHAIWNEHLSPTGHDGGLLCPSCMCKRAYDAGVTCDAVFRSGPFCRVAPLTCAMVGCSNPVTDDSPRLEATYALEGGGMVSVNEIVCEECADS